jgi:hypothetical protein
MSILDKHNVLNVLMDVKDDLSIDGLMREGLMTGAVVRGEVLLIHIMVGLMWT